MSLETTFRDYMIEHGVDATTADRAARACAARIRTNAVRGAVAGAAYGWFVAMPPGPVILALVGGAGAAGATLVGSPACGELRDAAFWLAHEG